MNVVGVGVFTLCCYFLWLLCTGCEGLEYGFGALVIFGVCMYLLKFVIP